MEKNREREREFPDFSGPPPPTNAESQKRSHTIAAPLMSRKRSPKHRRERPLPKVPKAPPKRAYDYTLEENAVIPKEHMEKNFAKKK
jgi:hypothetical protein